ncbi:MAG: hypothetical protein AB7G47_19905 [Mycolicibacterium sp.]|uniref:hypothetical protein n=1 Tax=Mycolicibacterium sp. TaxID=2320850 RepID=UPI003D0A58A7
MQKLTPPMIEALADAAGRWDRSLVSADRRTWQALHRRGLVDVRFGKGCDRRGHTTYNVVVDVKINDAGFQLLLDRGHTLAVAL